MKYKRQKPQAGSQRKFFYRPQKQNELSHIKSSRTREQAFGTEDLSMKDGSMELRKMIRELANRVNDEMVLRRVWKILERAYNSQE